MSLYQYSLCGHVNGVKCSVAEQLMPLLRKACAVHSACPDSIQEVVMSAKTGVCEVHVLLDGNVLEKWVLKEMSTGYQVSITQDRWCSITGSVYCYVCM